MFNQYTGDGQQSTNFVPVEQYFDSVAKALAGKLEVFVGETGYSTYWGADKQATVYKEIFSWLTAQQHDGGKTVPLFAFDAFDRPSVTPADQVQFGIYGENGSFQPTGLKADLAGVIPSWTTQANRCAVASRRHPLRLARPRKDRGAQRRRHRARAWRR